MAKIDKAFDMYDGFENNSTDKKIKLVHTGKKKKTKSYSQGMDNIINLYDRKLMELLHRKNESYNEYEKYSLIEQRIKDIDYTLEDIDEFSRIVSPKNFCENYVGLFFSALINNKATEGDKLMISFPSFNKLDYLAYGLNKDIELTINQSVGWNLANGMRRGRVIINGNCGNYAGESMGGGELIIKGDAGDYLGYYARNSKITVEGDIGDYLGADSRGMDFTIKGNAGTDLCNFMSSGKVSIGKDYISLADRTFWFGVKVYQGGKRIK